MPANTPSSTSTSADPTAKSSAMMPTDAPTEAPAPAPAKYAVGDVATTPGGALALVVKVTPPAEVDAGPIYDTVELTGAVTRFFGEDLDAEPTEE